ncbi:hypothetical protein FEN17_06325 [Dyadobacter luticola]|uniref:O-antigen ligase family protein n=1 Tax=Dyadobacter luticola TaxID=1979387 RepID=A0A5R9L3U5_9BACT|nr:hypothetical protein FEN17_06325 [Dyadobacter luticola]
MIFSLNFFSAAFAHQGIAKNLSYAFLLGAVVISVPYIFQKNFGFTLPIKLIGIAIIFSNVTCYLFWDQSLVNSVSIIPYITWFVFLYLDHIEYDLEKIEKIVIIYGFLYLVLFFYQFYRNDTVLFGFKEEFKEDRGVIRIDFPGGGIFYLAYFIALTKITGQAARKWLYVLFMLLGITAVILQVTRQSILAILIITLFHFLKDASIGKKLAVVGLFGLAVLAFFNIENPIATGLADKSAETASEGGQYIRLLAAEYFVGDFSPNIFCTIFGNGFPNNSSNYGQFHLNLGYKYGYFLSDLGIIAFFVMFGILPVIAYAYIFIKSIFIKVPPEFIYLRYYTFLILLTSFTSDYLYSLNFLIANIFVIYGYQVMMKYANYQTVQISYS